MHNGQFQQILNKHMTNNLQQKLHKRLPTQHPPPNKVFKTKPIKYNKYQNNKEDYPINTINLPTYHKLDLSKDPRISHFCTIRANTSIQQTFTRQRFNIFNLYSKMHYCFDLTFQSLFLAIDIFDKFMYKQKFSLSQIQISHISLACFMIAIKYEQVYPPSLDQIQSKMKIQLSFIQYVEIQFKILTILQYNLNLNSPIQYFNCFPCQLNNQKKSYLYLYLQLVCLNYQIKQQYNWNVIIQALKLLFKPLTQTLNKSIPQNIEQCLKKLMIQRGKLDQCYIWLNKKYCDPKFYCMAIKPCYIGQDI